MDKGKWCKRGSVYSSTQLFLISVGMPNNNHRRGLLTNKRNLPNGGHPPCGQSLQGSHFIA